MAKKLSLFFACLFLSIGMAMAQTRVTGKVVSSEDGEPVIGASVKVDGTKTGTVTDVDGTFSVNVPTGSKLTVSYLGMLTKTVVAKNNMRISLDPDNETLDEVVVVAYGTAKRQSITGAVSVVDSKKIEKRISTSVTAALEGSAPGIQVNNTYGEPGSSPSIRIRGIGSLVSGASAPLYVVDGAEFSGNISELNPNDIESMSVLKDAASAALYGNRAANGVILITTKHGLGSTKPSMTLKINHGTYNRGIPEYARMGADQWMETSWVALKNFAVSSGLATTDADAATYATQHIIGDYVKNNIYDGNPTELFDANGKLTAKRIAGYDDLDWEDNIERTGQRQEYTLAGSAAGDKYSVYSSVGYLNEKGYVIGAGYERFTGRMNTTFTPTKWFKAGMNLSGAYTNRQYLSGASGDLVANPFYTARYMAPVYPVYLHNADGTYALDANGEKQFNTDVATLNNRSIAYELRTDFDRTHRAAVSAQAYGTFTLPYGFSLTLKGDLNHSNTNRRRYNNPLIGDGAANKGRLTEYSYQYNDYTFNQILNWEHQFGVHHVDVMLGHENYDYNRRALYGMNTGFALDGNFTMVNFLTNSYFEGFDDVDRTESYIGRARYNFDEKYFADFSFRRDGSSRFHKDKRWGNFYSLGLNWNAKKEEFLKNVSWLNDLRVRASYGEVGNNMAVGYYAYQALYEINKNGGNTALLKQSLAANDIKWETTQTIDVAVEGRAFDRLNFSLGYFNKRSKDLLFEVRLPLSAGSYAHDENVMNLTQYKNIGTISNRGFEFSLAYDVIRNGDWRWNLATEGTFLDNEIIKLPDGKDILHGMQNYSEGHDAYEFYTYHFEGVDQLTGNSLYTLDPDQEAKAQQAGALVEINGTKYTTKTTYGKKDWAGTALPTYYGSFTSNLSWKGLTFTALFTYSLGGKVNDGTYRTLMSTSSASSASANHKDLSKSWTVAPAGMTETSANRIDKNGTPVIDFNRSPDNNAVSDRWLTSASYFVVKNLSLTYDLPKSLISNLGLTGVAVNAGVENLLTVTARKGLNPQYSFSGGYDDTYVTARVFNFGLTVNF